MQQNDIINSHYFAVAKKKKKNELQNDQQGCPATGPKSGRKLHRAWLRWICTQSQISAALKLETPEITASC